MSSTWSDPIYDNLDDISRFVMPYINSKAMGTNSIEFIVPKKEATDIIKERLIHSYHSITMAEVFLCVAKKFAKKEIADITESGDTLQISLNLPQNIEIDFSSDEPALKEDVHVLIKRKDYNKHDITKKINDLAYNTLTGTRLDYVREQLVKDGHIYIPSIGQSSVTDKVLFVRMRIMLSMLGGDVKRRSYRHLLCGVQKQFVKFISALDIRDVAFVQTAFSKFAGALGGNDEDLMWLKTLVERVKKSDCPIYSMEVS